MAWALETTQTNGQVNTIGGVLGFYMVGGYGDVSPGDFTPYKSNGSSVWTAVANPDPNGVAYIWVVSPTEIYATNTTAGEHAFKSIDGGTSWSNLGDFGMTFVVPIIKKGPDGNLYALSTSDSLALLKSIDGGSTWIALGGAGTLFGLGAAGLSQFFVVSSTDIYVAGASAAQPFLYHWDGFTWTPMAVSPDPGVPFDVWIDGSDFYVVGDATNLPVVWASHDGGATWSTEFQLPSPGMDGVFLSVTGDAAGVYVAGTNGGLGILYSTPGRSPTGWSQQAAAVTVPNTVQLSQVFSDGTNHYAVGYFTSDFVSFIPIVMSDAAPAIASITSTYGIDEHTVQIMFDNAPDQIAVLKPENWSVDNGLLVLGVKHITDFSYILTTTKQAIGTNYTITF